MGKQRTYPVCEHCDQPCTGQYVQTNEVVDGGGKVIAVAGYYHHGCLAKKISPKADAKAIKDFMDEMQRKSWLPAWPNRPYGPEKVYTTRWQDMKIGCPPDPKWSGVGQEIEPAVAVGWNAHETRLLTAGDRRSN